MKRYAAFLVVLVLTFSLLLSCATKRPSATLPTTSSSSTSSSIDTPPPTPSTPPTPSIPDQMRERYDIVFGDEISVSPTLVSFAPLSQSQSEGETVAITPTADDLRVIADKYNTGCAGEETFQKVKTGDTVGGFVIGENANGFGFSMFDSRNAALTEGGTFVFENIDFTDQRFIVIIGLKTPEAPLKLVFNNCRMGLLTTARDGSVPVTYEFNDCTLNMFDGSNATFRRCLFTGGSRHDGMNPFQNVYVYDSVILDKAPVTYDKEWHTDGVQIYGYFDLEAQNLHFDNLRVELPIVSFTDSLSYTNTPLMVSLDYNNARNISFTNCIANGGGNMIVLYDNPKSDNSGYEMTDILLSNIRTGANYKYNTLSTALGKSVMGEDIHIENLTETKTLYVASIWQENSTTHFSVTNDTSIARTLLIMTDSGTYTYKIPACPLYSDVLKDTFYTAFPFDIDLAIPEACRYAVLYDITHGTYEQIRSFSATDEPIAIDRDRFEEIHLPEDDILLREGGIASHQYNATWVLKRDGTLIISGDCALGNYAPTTVKHRRIQAYVDQIKRVIIEPGITGIGTAFFCGFTSLEEIVIPGSVTSIGKYAFQDCTSLKHIYLPYGIESIGTNAFKRCTALESIHIPSSVTDLGDGLFGSCSALGEATIACPITTLGTGMFDGCSALVSVSLPSTIETVELRAFYRCAKLQTIHFAGTAEQFAAISVVNDPNYNKTFFQAEMVHINEADLTVGEDMQYGKDEPKIPTLTVEDTLTKVYDGTPCEDIPYFETNSDGQVTITYAKESRQLTSPPTQPGRYVVIIDTAATEHYKAARASVTFFIHKIRPSLSMPNAAETAFTGQPATTPTFSTDSNAVPVISWKTADGTALSHAPIAPGQYVFTVTLPETDIYKGASKTIPFTILSNGGWDGKVANAFEKGDGTEASPYEIKTAAQLAYLSALLADEATYDTYASAHYRLTDNIQFNEAGEYYEFWQEYAPANAWSPIGPSDTLPFSGVFDGGGFGIKGLYLQTKTIKQVGLFGYLKDASVKNLSLSYIYFESTAKESSVGALCGSANNTGISAITIADASLSATRTAGGLLGQASMTSGVLTDVSDVSVSNATIKATIFGGGIVGILQIHGAKFNLSDANVAKSVTVSAQSVGGIFATAGTNPIVNLTNCTVSATLSATSAMAGGMVASITYTTGYIFSLENCTFDGILSGKTNAGGIFGAVGGTSGLVKMKDVTVRGSISATEGVCGGLFGTTSAACRDTFDGVTILPSLDGATTGLLFGTLSANKAENMTFSSLFFSSGISLVGAYLDTADTFDVAAFEAEIKQSVE